MKKISIKIISIIILCAFTLNTCAWALAPEAALTKAEFKEQYLAKYALLAHEAVNQYIKEQIQEKGIDSIKKRDESVVFAYKEVPIKIFAIDGLLANTGQFAHIGLGIANDLPVIYIDSKHFYNEKTLQRSKDIIWHEQDEIIQWEIERRKRKLSYEEMREWIRNDPEAKVLQEKFHKQAYPLDLNNNISFDDPMSKNYVDIDSVYHKYLTLVKNGEPGLDKDDRDANIAARKENFTKTVPREFIDKKMTTGDKSSSKTMETYKEVPRVAATLIASVRKSFSDGYLSLNEGQLKALTLMEEEFKRAGEITLLPDEYPEAKKWNSMISKYANWRDDIPIMLAHTFTHHRLMSIVNYWENKKDFFAGDKNSATEKALNNFSKQVEFFQKQFNDDGKNIPVLKELLYCSLKGNMADLTAPQIGGKHKEIIKDNAEKAAKYISKGLKRVDVFVDNTASEFLADLLLINFLLKKRLAKEVVVHVKHHPFLISDVTKQDAMDMIGRLIASSENNVKTVGKDLESFSTSGQLKFQEDPWLIIGNERIEIPEENKNELMKSDLIISKGDYLYRTFCGHYYHSYDSDINDAVKDLGLPPILFLRTMKVETALGIGIENVRKIEQYDPEWYKHGYGLIQMTEDNRKNKHQEEGIKRLIQQIKEYSYGGTHLYDDSLDLGMEAKEGIKQAAKQLQKIGEKAIQPLLDECAKLKRNGNVNNKYVVDCLEDVLKNIEAQEDHVSINKNNKLKEIFRPEDILKLFNPVELTRRTVIKNRVNIPLKVSSDTEVVLVCPDSGDNIPEGASHNLMIGPRRIASYLRHKDINAQVVDFCINDKGKFIDYLKENKPPIICFSILYDTLENDMENIRKVRQICPDSLIVIGGLEATNNSDEYIRKLPVDILVRGEGELPLEHIYVNMKKTPYDKGKILNACENIPGLKVKYTGGKMITTGPAQVMDKEKYLEVFNAYDLYLDEYEAYWKQRAMAGTDKEEFRNIKTRVIRMPSSNGCPYNCSFCAGTVYFKNATDKKDFKIVNISPEHMVDKIKRILVKDPTLSIFIEEENFLMDKKRVMEFCELVEKEKVKTHFFCKGRIDLIDQEMIDAMKKAGFVSVSLGIESFDEAVQKDFNKHLRLEKTEKHLYQIKENGMHCDIGLILFAPKITEDGLLVTMDKAIELMDKGIEISALPFINPYPGTKYYKNPAYKSVSSEINIPGTDETLEHPVFILPENNEIESAALYALKQMNSVIEEWKKEFQAEKVMKSNELLFLAAAHSTYKELGKLSYEKEKEIKNIAKRFFKGNLSEVSDSVFTDEDKKHMSELIEFAKEGIKSGEIDEEFPIVASIVDSKGDVLVKTGRTEFKKEKITRYKVKGIHAEVTAIQKAKEKGHTNWDDYTLYVNLAPCAMCTKTMAEFYGLKRVVYGQEDLNFHEGEQKLNESVCRDNDVVMVACDDQEIKKELKDLLNLTVQTNSNMIKVEAADVLLKREKEVTDITRKIYKKLYGKDVQVGLFDAELWGKNKEDEDTVEMLFRHVEFIKQNLNSTKDDVLVIKGEVGIAEKAFEKILEEDLYPNEKIIVIEEIDAQKIKQVLDMFEKHGEKSLKKNRKIKKSEEKIIQSIKASVKEYGETILVSLGALKKKEKLTITEKNLLGAHKSSESYSFKRKTPYSFDGTWKGAVKAAGFDLEEIKQRTREKKMIMAIQEAAEEYGAEILRYSNVQKLREKETLLPIEKNLLNAYWVCAHMGQKKGKLYYFDGTWKGAFNVAGYYLDKMSNNQKWTEDKIIQVIQEAVEEYGTDIIKAPGSKEVKDTSPLYERFLRAYRTSFRLNQEGKPLYFDGTWGGAVRAAGFDSKNKKIHKVLDFPNMSEEEQANDIINWTEEKIVGAIQEAVLTYGENILHRNSIKDLMKKEYLRYIEEKLIRAYRASVSRNIETGKPLFFNGRWERAVEVSGFEYGNITAKRKYKLSEEKIINVIRKAAGKYGTASIRRQNIQLLWKNDNLTKNEEELIRAYGASMQFNKKTKTPLYFNGTWKGAVIAAGFDYDIIISERQKKWTEKTIIQAIKKAADAYGEQVLSRTKIKELEKKKTLFFLEAELVRAYNASLRTNSYTGKPYYFDGTWKGAVTNSGFDYGKIRKIEQDWTEDKIIQAIKNAVTKYGEEVLKPSNIKTLRKKEKVTTEEEKLVKAYGASYSKNKNTKEPYYFNGTWKGAVKAAGFNYDEIIVRKGQNKGSPAALLETIKSDNDLLNKMINGEGVSVSEIAPYRKYSERTVHREFEILKDLGIFVPVPGKKGYYRLADMMIGTDIDYTKTMINAINDIKYQVGLRGDERPLHRGDIEKEKIDIVKELGKMTIIDQANIMQQPVFSKNKTLWHIIDRAILSSSQMSSFAQNINNASRRSDSNERIWITREDETVKQAMDRISVFCPDAVFDVALSNADKINEMPEKVKMLVFEGDSGDFCQLGGVVSALRALHLEKDRVVAVLLQIYKILNNSPYTGDISGLENITDPKEFARRIIFNLPPAVSLPIEDIPKLNDRLLKMLTAA